ncbi:MAG: GGDEF domain-containing protein, partial [Myxococcales bacterium]|nr:GGDEF domain-containing protein [Myxococcales bacterium]
KFSETEHSFTRLLTTIVASTYRVKMLAREVEERVVEISNIRTIARLVKGLRDETLSLSEAVHELFLSLSLEAVALLLPDSENGGVVLQRGVTFASYDEFLDEIERDDREQWRFVTLTDLSESERGVVACRLTAGNPTLHAIQRRVVDFFFVQIGLIYSERRFQQESITDPLTALFNRRYIMRVLNDRATLVRLDQTYVLSVVMIDIDRFKWINDAYGHQVGDEVLRAVATHLRESCRDSDVVGRYGGEEFIILMNAHLRGAVIAAEKMRQSLQPIVISPIDHPLEVTMSFGVATLDGTSARDIRDVIASADANLYVAKNAGRNRVIPSLFDGGEPEPIH